MLKSENHGPELHEDVASGDTGVEFIGPYLASEPSLRRILEAADADFVYLSVTSPEGRTIHPGVVARSMRLAFCLYSGEAPGTSAFVTRRVVAHDGSWATLSVGNFAGSQTRVPSDAIADRIPDDAILEIENATTFLWPSERRAFDEERLRLFESVVVHANDAVVITEAFPIDEPGPRVTYVNAAFERMTGYPASAIVGKTPRIMQGPLTALEARSAMRGALERWAPIDVELLNYRADGSTFWVELSLFPVADRSGWYRHWISIQRDVSARRGVAALASQAEYMLTQNAILSTEVANRKHAESRLEYFAYHDDLTGLRNRAYFVERLSAALSRTYIDAPQSFAVLFFDLDRFKIVNDSLGHSAGDRLLREVGVRVRHAIREADVAARMGGDEFAILIEDITDERVAIDLAERVIAALREPVAIGDISVAVQASVGVAFRPVDGTSAEAVLRDADIAMYAAKSAGGNRCVVFNDAMHERALQTFNLHADLQRALEHDEIVVHYQPIVALGTGDLRGFEALARWAHPTRGLVPPDEFIPAAEETGIIVRIGNCVLRKACAAMKAWRDAMPSLETLRVSVNVSPIQLQDALFFDSVVNALAEAGLPGSALELEITEGVFLDDTVRADALFAKLHELGVTIAIDDFGTGYSSLSYLRRYRIDVLKIDRSFVSSLTASPRDADLVRTIIGLGSDLGMVVLAEGVETAEQQAMLVRAGCQLAQGYHFAKPMDREAATQYAFARF